MKPELYDALKTLQNECKKQSSEPHEGPGNFCTSCHLYDYCDNGAPGDWNLKEVNHD